MSCVMAYSWSGLGDHFQRRRLPSAAISRYRFAYVCPAASRIKLVIASG